MVVDSDCAACADVFFVLFNEVTPCDSIQVTLYDQTLSLHRCCGHYGQIREFCYTVTSSCTALPHTSPPLIYRFPKCAAASDLFHFSSIHCVYHCYSLQIIVVHHACFV